MHLLGKIILACLCLISLMFGSFWLFVTIISIFSPTIDWIVVFIMALLGAGPTAMGLYGGYQLLKTKEPEPVKIQHLPQELLKTKDQELHEIFYKLLESKNGLLTVLNFAVAAKISGQEAKDFLEQKAKEFNHKLILSEEGEVAYKFEYLTEEEKQKISQK